MARGILLLVCINVFRMKISLRFSIASSQLAVHKGRWRKVIWEEEVDIIHLPSSTLCKTTLIRHQKPSPPGISESRLILMNIIPLLTAVWGENSVKKLLMGMFGHSPSHHAAHEAQKLMFNIFFSYSFT